MNKEEIRKLIGGYATGSLTDDERRLLFEAALDDQDLFDALQDEQAVKELFDDPISREQIRRAATESLPRAHGSWFQRPWIWAAGASVATAAVLLVVLVQWNPKPAEMKQVAAVRQASPPPPLRDEAPKPRNQVRVDKIEPRAKSAQPEDRRMNAKKEAQAAGRVTAAGPAPAAASPPAPLEKAEPAKRDEKDVAAAPPPAPPVQTEAQPQAAQQQQVVVSQSQSQSVPSTQQAQSKDGQMAEMQRPAQVFRARAIAPGKAGLASQLALRETGGHTFARRREDGSYVNVPAGTVFHPGETIRLTIVPNVSGPLVVSEWDAKTNSWMRVFPPANETVQIRELERYTVPIDITVKPGERLRVTVVSGALEIPIDVR